MKLYLILSNWQDNFTNGIFQIKLREVVLTFIIEIKVNLVLIQLSLETVVAVT